MVKMVGAILLCSMIFFMPNLAGDDFKEDVILKVKDGKGVGTATYSGMTDSKSTYSITVKPPPGYLFVIEGEGKTHSPAKWKVDLPLKKLSASASKTITSPTNSPNFFTTPLKGKMYKKGTKQGKAIPWQVDSKFFAIYSTSPKVEFSKLEGIFGKDSSFSVIGGSKPMTWTLSGPADSNIPQDLVNGTRAGETVTFGEIGADGKNPIYPGQYTITAKDNNGLVDVMLLEIPGDLLGKYKITAYNTPLETDYKGKTVEVKTVTASGNWSKRKYQRKFLNEAIENGSGKGSDGIVLTLEWYFVAPKYKGFPPPANYPPAYKAPSYNRAFDFRKPSSVKGSTGIKLVIDGSVAIKPNHPKLSVGDKVWIEDLGIKQVHDNGAGLVEKQLDLYKGFGKNSVKGWKNPHLKVIKLP